MMEGLANFHPIGCENSIDYLITNSGTARVEGEKTWQEDHEMMRIKSYASVDVNYIVRSASLQKRFRTKPTSVSRLRGGNEQNEFFHSD